jgi:hypothetical protein
MVAMIIYSIGKFFNFILAKRWNLEMGISDIFFIFFCDVVFKTLSTTFFALPTFSYFAKITPSKIEATMYAFLSGTTDFEDKVISPLWGAFLNYEFVGVTKSDLSGYSTLCLIALILSLFIFFLLPLIPKRQQLREWRKKRAEELLIKMQERRERRAKNKMM